MVRCVNPTTVLANTYLEDDSLDSQIALADIAAWILDNKFKIVIIYIYVTVIKT